MMYAPPHHVRRRRRRRAKAPTALGVGGGAVFSVGALFGIWTADQLHRMSVTYALDSTGSNAPTLPAGVPDIATYNDAAIVARPTWQSQAWQWGTAIFAGVLGLFVPWRMLKLFLYGTSLGTGIHATYQLVTGYIILPLVAGGASTGWGARAYAVELQANYSLGKMTKPASTTQGRLGAPPGRALPAHAPARVPVSLATRPATMGATPFPVGTPAGLGADAMPGGYAGQPGNPSPPTFPAGWTLKPVASQDQCPPGGRYYDLGADGKYCAVPPAAPPSPPPTPPTGGPPPPAPPAPPTVTPPAPPTASPSPPVPACPLPFMAAPNTTPCCGTNPCSCGVNGPPGTVLGQPRPPAHPLFAMMLAPRRAA